MSSQIKQTSQLNTDAAAARTESEAAVAVGADAASAGESAPTADEAADDNAEPAGEKKLSLLEHVRELRRVILVSLGALLLCSILVYSLAGGWLMDFILDPIRARGVDVIYTAVAEAFTTELKASILAGCLVAFPIIAWQLWTFIRPALYPKERLPFIGVFFCVVLLFALGVVFAYKLVFFLAINLFLTTGEGMATPMLSVKTYLKFLTGFLLPFGLAFELPVAIWMLVRFGVVERKQLIKARKFVVFGIFVLAALLTPPDVLSQCCLAIPLWLLYELGMIVAWLPELKQRRQERKQRRQLDKLVKQRMAQEQKKRS